MRNRALLCPLLTVALASVCASSNAHAQTACTGTGSAPATSAACLYVTQDATSNTGAYAIEALTVPGGDGGGLYAEARGSTAPAVSGNALGAGDGVYGVSATGYGVSGLSSSTSGSYGVVGQSYGSSVAGVYGIGGSSSDGTLTNGVAGVSYNSGASAGYFINSASGGGGYGVHASATNGVGVFGGNSGSSGTGVYGSASGGSTAVEGFSTGGNGVEGLSTSGNGFAGVFGEAGSGTSYGVWGVATVASSYAVFGENTAGGYAGNFSGNVSISGNLTFGGTCSGTACTSDIRLKKNVQSVTGSLYDLAKLRPVTFEWKDPEQHGADGTEKQWGFVAQEVEKVKPEWVGVDSRGFKTLNMSGLQIMLVDSVRTLKLENDDLRERVKSLEAGRRPVISGVGEGGLGFGLAAVAGAAVVITRRKRSDFAG